MKRLIYDFFILAYEFGAWVISPFNNKARLWLKGRINWTGRLQAQIKDIHAAGAGKIVWMHASSLGEFEQGKPVIDALRQQDPALRFVISFFSPSGYEVVKNKVADVITYLPTDTPANAQRFFDIVKPNLVIWVKYDYWYHHLSYLHRKSIPILLVSAIFWDDSVFLRWYGVLHRQMLGFFNHFFVQNESSARLLRLALKQENLDTSPITINGDTRFDRVITIAENWQPIVEVEEWLQGASKVVVAGSTWPEDDEELAHYVRTNTDKKFIIVPHNVNASLIKDSVRMFGNVTLYSELRAGGGDIKHVLLIDNVGMLSRLYKYATVCFVGGGFSGSGIHNVLEAAVYGKPVIHGPDFDRYQEAVDLHNGGGSFVAENAITLESLFDQLFYDEQVNKKAAEAAKQFIYHSGGSSRRIVDFIYENRLLTNP